MRDWFYSENIYLICNIKGYGSHVSYWGRRELQKEREKTRMNLVVWDWSGRLMLTHAFRIHRYRNEYVHK